jgi:hypothetical protein
MVREQERRIKVTRTIYDEPSDTRETYEFEGDPEVVKEALYDLGLFRRPKPLLPEAPIADERATEVLTETEVLVDRESRKARWKRIAEFIETQGPPEYVHSQASIELHFLNNKRLSASKDPAAYNGWFRPSRRARRQLRGKLGGKFVRSQTAGDDGSFEYRFVKS